MCMSVFERDTHTEKKVTEKEKQICISYVNMLCPYMALVLLKGAV